MAGGCSGIWGNNAQSASFGSPGPQLAIQVFLYVFMFFFLNFELFELRFTPCGRLEVAGELGETMPRAIALDPQSISSQFNVLFLGASKSRCGCVLGFASQVIECLILVWTWACNYNRICG